LIKETDSRDQVIRASGSGYQDIRESELKKEKYLRVLASSWLLCIFMAI
jgi:hypothetical protein